MIKISVIVPVYNTEEYLSKCLDSIVNQTLEEIEILVINDGSTDNSQQIIKSYTDKFPIIKAFQKENGGLSDARNFGLDRAEGEYVAFVDSDDFVDSEMFKALYGLAKKHTAEIAFCDLEKVDGNGNVFRDLPQSPQLPEKIILEEDFTLFGEMSCFACNKIFHRSLFENHRFLKGIHFEDIELIPKLVLESNIIAKVNQPYYKYFERINSISKTHTEKGLDMFIAIDNVKNAFEKSKFSRFKAELDRFLILQGFYSYLAYVAYVKDKKLKLSMLSKLEDKMKLFNIRKHEIILYKRFNRNYLFSLPFRKQIFYLMALIHKNLINNL